MEETRFCSVVRLGSKFFVFSEADADGPRKLKLPPTILAREDLDVRLSEAIVEALRAYEPSGPAISASEWDVLNYELLSIVGEESVSVYERKKSAVTVRHDVDEGVVDLFASSGELLRNCSTGGWSEVASAVKELL